MSLTLIVLTSFYPAGQHALRYAEDLASAQGGRLVLLHASRASLYDPYVFAGEGWRRQELEQLTEAETLLEQLGRQLRVPATVELATDLLPDMLPDLAQRHAPALFVLGLPKAGQATASQVSTAALELLRAAHYPVLLVPEDSTAPAPPHHVLVAADREAFALPRTADAAVALLALSGPEVTVAHVSPVEDDAGCALALRAVQRSGLVPDGTPLALQGCLHDDCAAGLLETSAAVGAELVVLLARERSYLSELFHRSVTTQLASQSRVPVLVLPVLAEPQAVAPKRAVRIVDDGLLWPEA